MSEAECTYIVTDGEIVLRECYVSIHLASSSAAPLMSSTTQCPRNHARQDWFLRRRYATHVPPSLQSQGILYVSVMLAKRIVPLEALKYTIQKI